jgi:hypothetical protein
MCNDTSPFPRCAANGGNPARRASAKLPSPETLPFPPCAAHRRTRGTHRPTAAAPARPAPCPASRARPNRPIRHQAGPAGPGPTSPQVDRPCRQATSPPQEGTSQPAMPLQQGPHAPPAPPRRPRPARPSPVQACTPLPDTAALRSRRRTCESVSCLALPHVCAPILLPWSCS